MTIAIAANRYMLMEQRCLLNHINLVKRSQVKSVRAGKMMVCVTKLLALCDEGVLVKFCEAFNTRRTAGS
jgi:hypothetical protein